MRPLWASVVLVVGCSSDPEVEPPPAACAKSQREGTFNVSFTEQAGGTCGELPGGLVNLSAPPSSGTECKVNHELWSENDCKLERDVTCTGTYSSPTTFGGRGDYSNHAVMVSRISDSRGSIAGTYTMTIDATGGACRSTYSFSAIKQ